MNHPLFVLYFQGRMVKMAKEQFELRENEVILVECKGDTWRTPDMFMRSQISGRFYFTNQRVAFRTWGLLKNSVAYDIEYENVESLSLYSINVIIRTGIQFNMKEGNPYKISVMKRDEKVQLMSEYITA